MRAASRKPANPQVEEYLARVHVVPGLSFRNRPWAGEMTPQNETSYYFARSQYLKLQAPILSDVCPIST